MSHYETNPDKIEDEIALTRQRINQRLSQLSDQTAPHTLLQKAVGARSGDTGDVIEAALRAAKKHPVSALLFGAGLAGMLWGARNDVNNATLRHEPVSDDPAERIATRAEELRREATDLHNSVSKGAHSAAEKISRAASSVGQTASDAAASGTSALSEASESAQRQAEGTYKIARNHAAHAARELPGRTTDAASDAGSWIRENPLPTGLMALAVGAAAASILTGSRTARTHDDGYPAPLPPERSPVTAEGDLPANPAATVVTKSKKPAKSAKAATTRAAATRTKRASGGKTPAARSKTSKDQSPSPSAPTKIPEVPSPAKESREALDKSTSVLGKQES